MKICILLMVKFPHSSLDLHYLVDTWVNSTPPILQMKPLRYGATDWLATAPPLEPYTWLFSCCPSDYRLVKRFNKLGRWVRLRLPKWNHRIYTPFRGRVFFFFCFLLRYIGLLYKSFENDFTLFNRYGQCSHSVHFMEESSFDQGREVTCSSLHSLLGVSYELGVLTLFCIIPFFGFSYLSHWLGHMEYLLLLVTREISLRVYKIMPLPCWKLSTRSHPG